MPGRLARELQKLDVFDVAEESATADLAGKIARDVSAPCTLYLSGDLGAGKTTFARYFLAELGHRGSVKSPTYTLVEPYELASGWVYHFDLYRVLDPLELELAGFEELFDTPSVRLIEWPQRGEGWLPRPDIDIRFQLGGTPIESNSDASKQSAKPPPKADSMGIAGRCIEVRYYCD